MQEYHKENGTGYVLKGLETIECLLEKDVSSVDLNELSIL